MQLRYLIAVLFISTLASAQDATVTATITGQDGCIYQNGTYNFNMTDSNGKDLTPGSLITVGPTAIYVKNYQGTLSGLGVMNQTITPANNVVGSPTGTQWRISINSQNPQSAAGNIPPQQSFKYTGVINGNTNLTSILSALAPPLNCNSGSSTVSCNAGFVLQSTHGPVCVPNTGGAAGNPAGPSFAVNFANSAVNAFQGDPTFTVTPSIHDVEGNLNSVINGAALFGTPMLRSFQTAPLQASVVNGSHILTCVGCTFPSPMTNYVAHLGDPGNGELDVSLTYLSPTTATMNLASTWTTNNGVSSATVNAGGFWVCSRRHRHDQRRHWCCFDLSGQCDQWRGRYRACNSGNNRSIWGRLYQRDRSSDRHRRSQTGQWIRVDLEYDHRSS